MMIEEIETAFESKSLVLAIKDVVCGQEDKSLSRSQDHCNTARL